MITGKGKGCYEPLRNSWSEECHMLHGDVSDIRFRDPIPRTTSVGLTMWHRIGERRVRRRVHRVRTSRP
jgi:hypothetical protein